MSGEADNQIASGVNPNGAPQGDAQTGAETETEGLGATGEDNGPEGETEAPAEGEGQPESPDADYVDLEVAGSVYSVPKAIRDGFMMHADYTQKTQKLAEDRRSVDERVETLTKQAKAYVDYKAELGELFAVDLMLQQFNQKDWAAAQNDDPLGTPALWMQFQGLKERRDQLAKDIAKKDNDRSVESARDRDNRIQEGERILSGEIKGWSPELKQQLVGFAKSEGLTEADIASFQDNFRLVRLLHKAFVSSQAVKKATAQTAAKRIEASKPTPAAQVRSRTSPAPTGLSDELSIDEWMKRRNAQVARPN
jgi:cell division protein FtsB